MADPSTVAAKAEAESLIPLFHFEKLLNQDQAGRRIILQGTIRSQPATLIAERAAFSTSPEHLSFFAGSLATIKNLGANDIYNWFLAWSGAPSTSSSTSANPSVVVNDPDNNDDDNKEPSPSAQPPDLKLNLIYPSTPQHTAKYSAQPLRLVTETPLIYRRHVQPYIQRQRAAGRLNWVFNILDGRTEQEDVLYREPDPDSGFLLLPDLNWDRRTVGSLHLLVLVARRDVWSVRDLGQAHVGWLKHVRERLVSVVRARWGLDEDQLKLYVHYHPTYYHFHVHVVHVMLEAGATQATGKALGLENVIAQLETMAEGKSMADVSLTYYLGEASELWTEIFLPLKEGRLQ